VTLDVDNQTQTGEVEVKGQRYPAQSETGEFIPERTKVVVVRDDGRFLWVITEE